VVHVASTQHHAADAKVVVGIVCYTVCVDIANHKGSRHEMPTKDLDSLRRAAEGATPESVEAATSFLRAANDELQGVLAARALGWFARGMALVDREQVVEALSTSEGYEAVLPLIEDLVLEDARESPMARARLRGIRRKREMLEAEGGFVGTAEAAEILGGISKQAVDKRRERRTILALPRGGGEYAFPLWQFDEGTRDGLVPGLTRVLKSFSVENPWMRAEFMLAPNARLGEKRPLDALRDGEAEAVARAASTYGVHGSE
jgi:hypothetical protein